MSAVVHTGSSEARSACGTKLIVAGPSARTIRGAASAAAEANADLRTSRRFMPILLTPPELRAPPQWRPRPDGVEQRPVAILQLVALRIRRPRLQSERADDPIVPVIALQHDAGERHHRRPAFRAQFQGHDLASCRVETGQRRTAKLRQ